MNTIERWCRCGAGVTATAAELALVAAWETSHSAECGQTIGEIRPVILPYLACEACGWRAYGDTRDDAEQALSEHATELHA